MADLLDESDEALSLWYQRIVRSQTDSLYGLTRELKKVLGEDPSIPYALRDDLVARLDELRP